MQLSSPALSRNDQRSKKKKNLKDLPCPFKRIDQRRRCRKGEEEKDPQSWNNQAPNTKIPKRGKLAIWKHHLHQRREKRKKKFNPPKKKK